MLCSQCDAVRINGVLCHEHGCPNQLHECAECGDMILRGERICASCLEYTNEAN